MSSNGYLGEDGVVERGRFGSPRCHLCGWYQQRLDSHIVEEHNMGVEEYRKFFYLSDNETLVAYIIENSATTPNSLPSDNSLTQINDSDISTRVFRIFPPNQNTRTASIIKRENPLNKKRKKDRWTKH